jgi:hypothetical protein
MLMKMFSEKVNSAHHRFFCLLIAIFGYSLCSFIVGFGGAVMRVFLCSLLIILLTVGCSGGKSKDKSVSPADLAKAINDYRAQNNRGSLEWKDAIADVAKRYAQHLDSIAQLINYTYGPNYDGTPNTRLSGLYNSWCGEAEGRLPSNYSASEVINYLTNNSVLLDSRAKSIGIGRVTCST